MSKRPFIRCSAAVVFAAVGLARAADAPPVHFHPKGKAPSPHTMELHRQVRASLPFEDERDFEESRRGFIAAPTYRTIRNATGDVVWDMASFDFLQQDRRFESVNPSLQRQAVLNMGHGLYEVVPGRIYQVRGFDISNISFVKGDSGWIVFDPLLSSETAAAALAFVNEQLGQRPVVAVVYSHSHVDHFGGVRGVVDEADVRDGKVPVIAPAGFQEEAVAENLHAANAMVRRAYYQYGLLLPRSPYGHVDQAIGKTASTGSTGLIAPTRSIAQDIEEVTIDGVTMVFQNTPGSEAPVEMNTWFPQFKAFWAAENITGTIHNIYTLRGALIRDPLAWSKHINSALYSFGQHADVMFASHNWPRWGSERVQEIMRVQRDVYANLHNDVMHAANDGVTINQIHNVYRLPESLQRHWAARSYHGSEAHNSRGVINRYLGYWDGNPATLIPVSPEQSAPLYVEMMGGADRILARARTLVDDGEYLLATEILNKLVCAEPGNQRAKDLLADAFEQVGYQQESSSLRNTFLAAALELRSGIPAGLVPRTATPDTMRAMSTGLWLDYLGILVDSRKAAGVRFVANLVTPDNGEQFVLEMSNATLTNIEGFRSPAADVTITLDRADLEQVMMRKETFRSLALKRRAKFEGNAKALEPLAGTFGAFDPFFEIMPGTKPAGAAAQ
ncbi:MAG TPA: alkyl sulfatase dimerization domain-containing protein [Steroidobacteraceae bacterium]|nr:alkyl sulfatase dimerization domain-containing protein [Steroidobacteraceae bacterium]